MTLEQATKMARKDAVENNVVINIIFDKLSEEEEKYTYVAEHGMDIFYPENRKDFWELVDVIIPNS